LIKKQKIGAPDVNSGNVKVLLPLLWRLVQKYQIEPVVKKLGMMKIDFFVLCWLTIVDRFCCTKIGNGAAKRVIVDWVRSQVHAYDGVTISDLTTRYYFIGDTTRIYSLLLIKIEIVLRMDLHGVHWHILEINLLNLKM
jgi:hypothetical protein